MTPLQHPDTLYLQAAIGWLELGDHIQANEELEKIRPTVRVHPDVLVVRWQIYAKAEQWERAFDIARTLVQLVPEFPLGWVYRAEALRRMPGGDLEQAWESLVLATDRFPKEPIVLYKVACYVCQMGRWTAARAWLEMAFKAGDRRQLKLMALNDPDLEPLWSEIGSL